MEAAKILEDYKKIINPLLQEYFKRKINQAEKINPLFHQAVKTIADFTMAGGKRIRPAMVYYGYLAAGGRSEKEILEASISIELIHSFLLIHDDIIDCDGIRHGIKTVHEKYKEIGKIISLNKDNDNHHFGNSMAIIVGDIAHAMGYEILFNAKFSPEIIIKALDKLQKIVYDTIPGEMLDVIMENRGTTTEEEILGMFESKTSRYTFEGPLYLGAILAGADEKFLKSFTKYALPLGKAFQIRDDILGVYGDEEKLGKPVGSDVIEGKQTLLLLKAIENGSNIQRDKLKKYLGKKDLAESELEDFRKIIRDTGSLEYSCELADKFIEESVKALEDVDFRDKKAEIFLRTIADYVVRREI